MKSEIDKGFAAFLPMKGHSERVKNKNLKPFNNKPLFYYVLTTLLQCNKIKHVYIDTDSDEIRISIDNLFPDERISVIRRNERLCGDYVSMNDIIAYDIQLVEENFFLQTHATNPLLTSETIESACEVFKANIDNYDSLFSVNRIQTRLYDENGTAINHDPEKLIRTQDLEPLYEENSNIYIFTRESFIRNKRRIGRKPYLFEMDQIEAIDIDTERDFYLAEYIYRLEKGEK